MQIIVAFAVIAVIAMWLYIWTTPEHDPYEFHPGYDSEYEND